MAQSGFLLIMNHCSIYNVTFVITALPNAIREHEHMNLSTDRMPRIVNRFQTAHTTTCDAKRGSFKIARKIATIITFI